MFISSLQNKSLGRRKENTELLSKFGVNLSNSQIDEVKHQSENTNS